VYLGAGPAARASKLVYAILDGTLIPIDGRRTRREGLKRRLIETQETVTGNAGVCNVGGVDRW
jgi:hypothetical protein